MAVRRVRVLGGPDTSSAEVIGEARKITVVKRAATITETNKGLATKVVRPGGTVANVGYGDTLPPNPTEGQIFILTT